MTTPLYEQEFFPAFQNRMYDSPEEARNCPKGNIRLVEDALTGLVRNVAFQPELMVYDQHYQNEQGNSLSFLLHLELVAAIVERLLGRQKLIEVGCGKGCFLEMLAARGVDITGFDPAYEGQNTLIRREKFSPGLIDRAPGLILRHVLEHVQDPVSFLSQIAQANENSGRIYIEVPCFDWICKHRAWFDIYYEHVNYFRLNDFHRMFGKIVESGYLFGGQYVYVVAEIASLRQPTPVASRAQLPADFMTSIQSLSVPKSQPRVVWGGASKGVIFALLMERYGAPVHAVIDVNPAKQGKYIAATGLRIGSPEEVLRSVSHGSAIYVMNSNYLEEIRGMTCNAYTYIGVEAV